MGFPRSVVDRLLAETGRMCAICNRQHGVQVHHIQPREQGGADTSENAIPLCPNCHDEVHSGYAPGRVSRTFTAEELRQHLVRTKQLASQRAELRPGSETWHADVERLRFFSLVLDRPAFRHHFHQELSFANFDQAMEDTVLAINTGYWRTRDGEVIERGQGKSHLVNPAWRSALDDVVRLVGEVRSELRQALTLDEDFYRRRFGRGGFDEFDDMFRWDGPLGHRIDDLRAQALDALNGALEEAGLNQQPQIGQ